MKIKQQTRPDGKIQLDITVPADRVNEVIDNANMMQAYRNGINPSTVDDLVAAIQEKLGEELYKAVVDNYVMTFLAPFAITKQKLNIIMAPEVHSRSNVERNRAFDFTVIVTPKPVYELESYDPVSFTLPKVEITAAEIENQLLNIAQAHTSWVKDEDRPVATGDNILIAIDSKDSSGETIRGLTADSRQYTVGEGFMPEDFDKNIIGLSPGETKTFEVSEPEEDVDPSMRLGTVTITVTIKEIQKQVIPAITDSWVEKNMPGTKNVPELRERVKEDGIRYKTKELENMKTYLAASELAKRFKSPIPDEFYEFTRSELMQGVQQQARQAGLSLEDFIAQNGGDQQFGMMMMLQTREVLTQSFSLDALARHLKLTIDDSDIEAALSAMAPGHEKEARREFEFSSRMYLIEEAALRTKANKWLVETAEIKQAE